ncbi:MAG TPA: hypothetical protein PLJ39_02045 [Spirochaetota bacterium]|nr:hypothetical protein [Spirochaetota bacterium]HPN29489.1 hypothetical protein [bacterium]HPN29510.1 hypothetical protein [bacterium]
MKLKLILSVVLMLWIIQPLLADDPEPETFKPKVFGYVEGGERWVESSEEDDYEQDIATTETYYKYDLKKIGFSQKLSKTSFFSLSYKVNDKEYENLSDTGLSNNTKTIFGYIRFRLSEPLTFKLEGNVRKSSYDLTESDFKENDWTSGAVSLIYQTKKEPEKNWFFNSKKQRYLLKFGYKRHIFPNKAENNANTSTVLFNWDYKHNDKLVIKSKFRVYNRDYEISAGNHSDSSKQSYQIGAEYQF